jgi:hypothetical protein
MLEQHHLVLDGVQLDDNRTLTDYDIQHQSTLDLQENMQIYVMDTLAGTNIVTPKNFNYCFNKILLSNKCLFKDF